MSPRSPEPGGPRPPDQLGDSGKGYVPKAWEARRCLTVSQPYQCLPHVSGGGVFVHTHIHVRIYGCVPITALSQVGADPGMTTLLSPHPTPVLGGLGSQHSQGQWHESCIAGKAGGAGRKLSSFGTWGLSRPQGQGQVRGSSLCRAWRGGTSKASVAPATDKKLSPEVPGARRFRARGPYSLRSEGDWG